MTDTDKLTLAITTLNSLLKDLTNPKTNDRIRRGPHVALIQQTLNTLQ